MLETQILKIQHYLAITRNGAITEEDKMLRSNRLRYMNLAIVNYTFFTQVAGLLCHFLLWNRSSSDTLAN